MKRLLATGLLLLLASVPLFAQEKVAIVPPPSADTSATADAESTSATPGEKTALPSAQEITRTLPTEPGKEPQLNEHEIAILNPETQEWEVSEFAISESRHSPADLYLEGGYGWMTALTLCLIAMLFCTWKAPRWIKELGLLACTLGVLSMMIGFYSILQIIQTTGYSVTFTLLSGGLRVAFIAPIYGLIIYALSLLLRIAVKPRI